MNQPISVALAGTGNSSVFRQAVSRTGFSYVLAECGLRLLERTKRAEIVGRIRTFFDAAPRHCSQSIITVVVAAGMGTARGPPFQGNVLKGPLILAAAEAIQVRIQCPAYQS